MIQDTNIEVLVAPANIFNAEILTDAVTMDNFQAAHFVISSGVGEATKVKAEVVASSADGEETKVIAEQEITVGDKTREKIVVNADKLAHDGFDRVSLKIASAGKSDIIGTVCVIFTNERYSK